jgi:hypothetical protein
MVTPKEELLAEILSTSNMTIIIWILKNKIMNTFRETKLQIWQKFFTSFNRLPN